jgi:hypothetical protein
MRLVATLALLSILALPSLARAADEKEECASAAERAQSDRESRRFRSARQQLLRCARETCPSAVRIDCATWLDQVSASLPTLALHARNDRGEDLVDVTVDVDGERVASKLDGGAIPVDPGEHVVHFAAPGLVPADVKVVVVEGDKARSIAAVLATPAAQPPVVVPERPSPPVRVGRILAGTSLGVGIAALGAFAGLEVVGQSEFSSLKSGCGVNRSCTEAQVSPVRTKFQAAGAMLGVGIAGVVGGTVGLIVEAKKRVEPRAWVQVGPLVGGGMLVVAGHVF